MALRALILCLALFLCPPPSGEEAPDLGSCLDLAARADRSSCFGARLTSIDPRSWISTVKELDDPSVAVEIVELLESHPDYSERLSPESRADLADLRGEALYELGRFEESAQVYVEALELDDGTDRLTWLAPEGRQWAVRLGPGKRRLQRAASSLERAGRPGEAKMLREEARLLEGGAGRQSHALKAKPWFPKLPRIEVPLLDGGSISLAEAGHRVILLDFWATWCGACVTELPHLQELWESERERGFLALAVNVGEQPSIALPFARDLGLTMPIVRYDETLQKAFRVEALPTVIVADRQRRLRARWDQYQPGFEKEIAQLVLRLLDQADGPSDRQLGEILAGDGLLEVAWLRKTPSPIEGLLVVPAENGGSAVLASLGRSLALYEASGRVTRLWDGDPTAASLRRARDNGATGYKVLGFRPGATRLAVLEMPSGSLDVWEVPGPLFDVAPVPEPGDEIVLGTSEGLVHGGTDGDLEPLPGFSLVTGLAWTGHGTGTRLAVLSAGERGGTLSWLDRSLDPVARLDGLVDAWGLVVDPEASGGVGVVPPAVRAAVVGRFLSPDSPHAAVATRSGQLVLIDLRTGTVDFRANWSGVSRLAAGNLLGDGRDELLAATAGDLAVLTAAGSGVVAR